MSKVLVTGATGFIGGSLLKKLNKLNVEPIVVTRGKNENVHYSNCVTVEGIDSKTDWKGVFNDCDVVIHCAARVHQMRDKSLDPLSSFREVNTFGTLNLAKKAAQEGVKRFIFISSIKVSGEYSRVGNPFKSSDEPNPTDPYGISKFEAEVGLKILSKETAMEVVIIRPPLVYGQGVKGNFASLLQFASRGIPLPFGAIKNNLRSFVSVDNLVDLIVICISHPNAANRVFLISDDRDLSTAEMFRQLSKSFGKSGFMIPMPVFLYKIIGSLTGKSELVERLCGNLQVDISDTKSLLDWKPVITYKEAFARIADSFLCYKE